MQIEYFKGNFGDDLNAVMWPKLLPKWFWDVPNVSVIGIGSILNERFVGAALAAGNRVFVMGSGAEYGRLPVALDRIEVLAVRGPLTAELIGQPDKAASDAAVLLSAIPEYRRDPDPRDVIFIPHYLSAHQSRWREAAKLAGLTYVDPEGSVDAVMNAIRSARLVVTEAMHGAIVADTLRVPWIPVRISPMISNFKWRDWTLTLDLPFEPQSLSVSSEWERRRNVRISAEERQLGLKTPTGDLQPAALIEEFRQRYAVRADQAERHSKPSRLRHARRVAAIVISKSLFRQDRPLLHTAAEQLRRIAAGPSYLSEEGRLFDRRDQLLEAVDELGRRLS